MSAERGLTITLLETRMYGLLASSNSFSKSRNRKRNLRLRGVLFLTFGVLKLRLWMRDDWDGLDLLMRRIHLLSRKPISKASVDGRPLKELGFDPILKMPDFEAFAATVGKG